MAVGRSDHAELVWIGAELLLQQQAVLQCLAGVFILQHFRCLGFGEIKIAGIPGFVIGEFVVG